MIMRAPTMWTVMIVVVIVAHVVVVAHVVFIALLCFRSKYGAFCFFSPPGSDNTMTASASPP